jgi:glutathione S-transferase
MPPAPAPTAAPYRFLAYDVSYFSGKVRPALRYKQLWYEERRAHIPEIQQRTGMAFIPVLVTPEDETWQDSTDILENLERRHPTPPLFPKTPVQRIAAQLIELYVDEFGVTPAMHTRWGTELGESSARARFSAMMGSAELGNRAADRMVMARKLLGATEETGPALDDHIRDLFDAESAHFENHPYLLGDRMSVADCALMGQHYAHFFVDLSSRRLLLETALHVVSWIERCNFPHPDEQGEWLADDALAPTLREVLGVMGRDGAPVILDGIREVEAWADARPDDGEKPPRFIGSCKTSLRDTPMERGASSYALWSVQRVVDFYLSLSDQERRAVDSAVAGTGWEPLLAYRPRHRLAKRGFTLVFDE